MRVGPSIVTLVARVHAVEDGCIRTTGDPLHEPILVESLPVCPDLRGRRVALGLVGRTDFGTRNGKFITDLRSRVCAAIAHRFGSLSYSSWLVGDVAAEIIIGRPVYPARVNSIPSQIAPASSPSGE